MYFMVMKLDVNYGTICNERDGTAIHIQNSTFTNNIANITACVVMEYNATDAAIGSELHITCSNFEK